MVKRYMKGKNDMDYPEWLINIVRNNDECSRKEIKNNRYVDCLQKVV